MLEDRATRGQAFAGGQGHWMTDLHWRTGSLEDGSLLEDRVAGGQAFAGVLSQEDRLCWRTGSLEDQSAGGWSLKTDFAEGQGHWRTGSLEDGSLLEYCHRKTDFAGGQGRWRMGLCWRTGSLEDQSAGGWSLKTDFAEGQGH